MLSAKSGAAPVQQEHRSGRRNRHRAAKLLTANGSLPRNCLVTDISDGGVRLLVEGYDAPDEFVLLLSGDDIANKERLYKVVWRLGGEIGAKFIGHIRRSALRVNG